MEIQPDRITPEGEGFLYKKYVVKLVLCVIAVIIFAFIYQTANNIEDWNVTNENQKPLNFDDSLHYSAATFTTTGYGDIYPLTQYPRYITYLQMFLTLCVILY